MLFAEERQVLVLDKNSKDLRDGFELIPYAAKEVAAHDTAVVVVVVRYEYHFLIDSPLIEWWHKL